MKPENIKNIILALILLSPLLIVVFIAFNVLRDPYVDGCLPVKDASKYFINVKEDVFKKKNDVLTKESKSWIRVIDSNKGNIQLCATDSIKFKSLLLGKDSLAIKTMNDYKNMGYEWGVDEELGYYFSLPRETVWDESNYIKVPTWLMAVLIDEGVLNIKQPLE